VRLDDLIRRLEIAATYDSEANVVLSDDENAETYDIEAVVYGPDHNDGTLVVFLHFGIEG
jgi:hypothetical protein